MEQVQSRVIWWAFHIVYMPSAHLLCVLSVVCNCSDCYLFNASKHWTKSLIPRWKIILTHFRQTLLFLFVLDIAGAEDQKHNCSTVFVGGGGCLGQQRWGWYGIQRLTYPPIALNIASFALFYAVCTKSIPPNGGICESPSAPTSLGIFRLAGWLPRLLARLLVG